MKKLGFWIGCAVAVITSAGWMDLHAQTAAAGSPPSYKEWTMAELLPSLAQLGTGRDWTRGRELFAKGACGGCHAFGRESQGTGLAPDLTGVSSRFSREVILQSILEPSAEINSQYTHTTFTLKNGTVITGSVIDVAANKIIVVPVMLAPNVTVEIAQADVTSEEPSLVSPMPIGLLNAFTKDEILELMAFLEAGGDRSAPVYEKR
jgi:putative heme-binding domain-containing protein